MLSQLRGGSLSNPSSSSSCALFAGEVLSIGFAASEILLLVDQFRHGVESGLQIWSTNFTQSLDVDVMTTRPECLVCSYVFRCICRIRTIPKFSFGYLGDPRERLTHGESHLRFVSVLGQNSFDLFCPGAQCGLMATFGKICHLKSPALLQNYSSHTNADENCGSNGNLFASQSEICLFLGLGCRWNHGST
jgi:hypothetical protein